MIHSKIEGQGFPLFIIHGFLGMLDNWKTLGLQFSELGFQVHMLDMRNHGKSFHSDDFTYELMVDDVIAYANRYQIDQFHCIGHSMGGKVAMLLACKFPNRISKLIVADIGPKYYAPHHQTILKALNAVDFSQKPSRQMVQDTLSEFISDFGTLQFMLKNLYWKTPEELAFRFNLKTFNEKIEEIGRALPESYIFESQVLFLRGGNSDYIQEKDLEQIHAHFPKAILQTIEGAGHWLHAEKPKDFFEKVKSFL